MDAAARAAHLLATRRLGLDSTPLLAQIPRMEGPPISPEIMERVLRPEPCDDEGFWWEDVYARPAWTPRGFLIRGDRFILSCNACGRKTDAPAQKLIDDGKGDWPWARFSGKWRCECGSKDITVEVEAKPLPAAGIGEDADD